MVYNNQEVFKMTCFGHLSVIYLNALEGSQPGVSSPAGLCLRAFLLIFQQVRPLSDTCLASVEIPVNP
jgi:hypothetical protein